jgi:hypothetical protein
VAGGIAPSTISSTGRVKGNDRHAETEDGMSNENGGNALGALVIAFLAGAATGAAVALLTSPKSGPELRATIGGKVDEVKERVRGLVAERKGSSASQPVHEA